MTPIQFCSSSTVFKVVLACQLLFGNLLCRQEQGEDVIMWHGVLITKTLFCEYGYFCLLRGSDSGLYHTPPILRGPMEGSFASEDLSLTLPPGCGGGRESDQLSVSSSSSVGGPSPRDRRCLLSDSNAPGIYLPMAPLSSSSHSPASNSKVSVSSIHPERAELPLKWKHSRKRNKEELVPCPKKEIPMIK